MKLTHPEKVLYPELGLTKRDLFDYYARVAKWMVPHVARRPLNLRRCPHGWKRGFFQQHAHGKLLEGLRKVDVVDHGRSRRPASGGSVDSGPTDRLVLDDATGLHALAQMNVLEVHAWGARVDVDGSAGGRTSQAAALDKPDLLVFDLDPDPTVAFGAVIEAARAIRQRLGDLAIESWVKTSGGKGLHVCVAIERTISWDRARAFTRDLSEGLVRDEPSKYVATMSKAKRPGKIFIDFFRNGKGATVVAPYSPRARAGAPVAVPVDWDELDETLTPNGYSFARTIERLEKQGDAWARMPERPQRIPP